MNRILKTAIKFLIRSDISKERKKQLRKLMVYFSSVDVLDVHHINWHLHFNRNNQEYRMLVAICFLIFENLLQTDSEGNSRLMNFDDIQKKFRLYEKFILEYYKKEHPELKTSASQIPWNLDDGYNDMLPVMQSDIMLQYKDKTLIIDAKYYEHSTQEFFNVSKHRSDNLYQIYTYVKNLDKERTGNVSGMLLYAKTDDQSFHDNQYQMGGNLITVANLDLSCDFSKIRKQLDDIVIHTFGIST